MTEPSATDQAKSSFSPLPTVRLHGGMVQDDDDGLEYLTGFGNTLQSETIPGALTSPHNNPKQPPYGLYTEQLSGTAFTAPRRENQRTWLYRMQPSVATGPATKYSSPQYLGHTAPSECRAEVNPLRWKPKAHASSSSDSKTDFIAGLHLHCHAGDAGTKNGLGIYLYTLDSDMVDAHLCNADGHFLLIPQQGGLEILTELGRLRIRPGQVAVVPRGIVMQVRRWLDPDEQHDDFCRGYVLEVYSATGFQLPELGPIGSNGLANARDFYYPVAWCVQDQTTYRQECTIVSKFRSELFSRPQDHSPYNVVAWHGNYLPYKYDLTRFCAVGSVSYDHLDPSIYTVLTCPSDHAGTALADFVLFPHRFMATDRHTFRPPWFHRNTMSEYMGLICGQYDAKRGFEPGGASLHNVMTPHGPDKATVEAATNDPCEQPRRWEAGMAFMLETCLPLTVAPTALEDASWRDMEYQACWDGLVEQFTGWKLLGEAGSKDEEVQTVE